MPAPNICPACGAPLNNVEEDVCPFCGFHFSESSRPTLDGFQGDVLPNPENGEPISEPVLHAPEPEIITPPNLPGQGYSPQPGAPIQPVRQGIDRWRNWLIFGILAVVFSCAACSCLFGSLILRLLRG